MSGHLFNAQIDSVYPASLSNKTLTGLLRDSLGFDGLIITDGMFMGAISNNYTFAEAVELAINAGNDILLYTTNKLSGKSLVDSVVGIVMNKISEGKITEQRINESYNRIMLKKLQLTNVNQNNAEFIPNEFGLINYPNPFNTQTNIVVKIPVDGNLSIKIFNIVGEVVAEIMNDFAAAGTYKFTFNADKLSSGIYLISMKMNNKILTHKAVLLK